PEKTPQHAKTCRGGPKITRSREATRLADQVGKAFGRGPGGESLTSDRTEHRVVGEAGRCREAATLRSTARDAPGGDRAPRIPPGLVARSERDRAGDLRRDAGLLGGVCERRRPSAA